MNIRDKIGPIKIGRIPPLEISVYLENGLMTENADTNEMVETNEAQIASHWREEELIEPNLGFVAQANMGDPAVFDRFSAENFPECYREYADLLTWDQYWHTTLDTSNPPFWNCSHVLFFIHQHLRKVSF